MTGERCGCEESRALRAELERLKAGLASPLAERGAPHVIGRPGEAHSSAAKHSSDLLNRLSDPCVHLSGRDYEVALTATEHRDAAIATAADRAGYERALRDIARHPECVSIRHVCEALRQMPSAAAPAGEGGA